MGATGEPGAYRFAIYVAGPERMEKAIRNIEVELAERLLAGLVLGWSWELSLLFGAIVSVTGPTVITPILRGALFDSLMLASVLSTLNDASLMVWRLNRVMWLFSSPQGRNDSPSGGP